MRKMKYLVFIMFVMFMYIISINNVFAFTCKYGQGHKDFTAEYKYDVTTGNYKLSKVYLTNDYVTNADYTDTYKKWFDVELKKEECPEIYIDGTKLSFSGKTVEEQMEVDMGGCSGYTFEKSCNYNEFYSCIWNENEYGSYCNTDQLVYVSCGDVFDIPAQVPEIISFLVNLLKIAAPIILIMVSIISLLKALSASSEDEIKKAQKGLIKKIGAGVMVFFVISIVQFVILKVADTDNSTGTSEADNLSSCLTCFLNNDCSENAYYKTSVFGEYKCTYFSDKDNPRECN